MKIALFISRKNQLSVDCCIEIINLLGADNDISIDQAYKSYFSEDILSKVSFFDSSKKIETNHDFLFSIGGDGTILRSITYIKDSKTEIFPAAIGLFFVLSTLLSKSLSTISLKIQPALLIKKDPRKNNIIYFKNSVVSLLK